MTETIEKERSQLIVAAPAPTVTALSVFDSAEGFELAQRMAKSLVTSNLVPKDYQGAEKIGNAIIALDMARRTGANPVMVMQNLDVIHGRPSWRSQFIIAALNASGLFSPLRFVVSGEGDAKACYAWAKDLNDGERLEGPAVSIDMAKKEGWFGKQGSKWQTMPDLMLRYRAAAFFGRLYAPHVLMGMPTADEVEDTPEMRDVTPAPLATPRDPEYAEKTSAPSPVKVPEPASTGRGRPSKAETDAAEAAGRKARRQGAPRETAPADLKPSLKAAWEAGWDAEPETAPVDPTDGAPFDMSPHDPETGEVIDAPTLVPATSSSGSDDFGFGE